MRRPAETGSAAGSVGLLIGRLLGVTDPDTLAALGVVVGLTPAAITWAVTTYRGCGTGKAGHGR